ncbi:helix-turn-helix domain-containing protein [Xanthovirga aplysinae]|uniref:helix-turn-helix domain-containing protein n=1 Tax=Xanthovirga aplysinae TaxID=2529853 RepID=UPI0012BBB433|nr:helix-turn-helix domain-containing protein [Xanthovirga aplysinae]MTI31606.1 AraC family transcriptional regulator [Xanthovirga aplysinae]
MGFNLLSVLKVVIHLSKEIGNQVLEKPFPFNLISFLMIKDALLYIGLAQSLFAALVLITKPKVYIPDKILVICLLTIAFRFFVKILHYDFGHLNEDFSLGVIPMLFGPYFYLYTAYTISGKLVLNTRDLWHFVPFILMVSIFLLFYNGKVSFNTVTFFVRDQYLPGRIVFGLIFYSSILIYTIFTFIKLSNYRRLLKAGLENYSSEVPLFWLSFLTFFFSALFFFYLILGGINAFTFSERFDISSLSHIGLTILAYVVSYFGLRQTNLTSSEKIEKQEHDNLVESISSGLKNKFSSEEAEDIMQELKDLMEKEEPYLNPELTLGNLANRINISKYDLTYLLNNHLGKNFFAFVNEFRLRAVIRKLENSENNHLTIISIAYDCGFNSKSSFNTLFKKQLGLTPSEYRKKMGTSPNNKSERICD